MRNIVFHPGAEQDFYESIKYYATHDEAAEKRFRAEVAFVLEKIDKYPFLFREVRPGIRKARLRKFPFSVLYRVRNDDVRVLAIVHASRRPGYWDGRN